MSNTNRKLQDLLVCPYSLGPLTFTGNKAESEITKEEYPIVNGQIDLRLKRSKKVHVDFVVGEELNLSSINFNPIETNKEQEVDFSSLAVPQHMSSEILSYFPKAKNTDSFVLDLGCGTGLHRQVCEKAGYKYIGLDYRSRGASVLGDAHSLPFADNSIDFVISISVMEHIQYPWIMAKEVMRVLKPNGRFIGMLSFLEPFHEISYYHTTHAGVLTNLKIAGFEKIKVLAPNKGWEGIEAMSNMHYFSSLPSILIKAINFPYYILHRLWWKFAELTKRIHYHPFNDAYRLLASSGSFIFVVDK